MWENENSWRHQNVLVSRVYIMYHITETPFFNQPALVLKTAVGISINFIFFFFQPPFLTRLKSIISGGKISLSSKNTRMGRG